MGNADSRDGKDTKAYDVVSSEKSSEDAARRESIIKSDEAVRSRFVKGLQYNMKIVLRGERYTGKTSLFKRFQGSGFLRTYIPSPEIQTTMINWNMKNCPDNVRVEVWDVVDKGIVVEQSKDKSIKLQNINNISKKTIEKAGGPGKHQFGALDSSVLDVYTGCHTAIFIINPFDIKSYEYVQSNHQDVPRGTAILILQSFRDQIMKSPDDPEPTSDTLSSKSTDTVNSLQNNEVIIGIKTEKENNEDIKSHRVVVTTEMIEQLVADIKAQRIAADASSDASASLLSQLQTIKCQIQEYDTSLSTLISASSYSAFAKAYEIRLQEKLEASKLTAPPAQASSTKDVVVSSTHDSDSSDYELTSIPEVQGDRYEKRKKVSANTSIGGTLKLSHDGVGSTDSVDYQEVVVKRPSKPKSSKSKPKNDEIQAFRPGGNDSIDKFLDSDDDQRQASKENAAALSSKTKKKGGFVDIKLRGAPGSDNSEEEEKMVSRPSPLVKKGLTKVGKKKGDSAVASPVTLTQSPVTISETTSKSSETSAISLPLDASSVANVVPEVSSYTSTPSAEATCDTTYIEAHWGEESKGQKAEIKKISSNSSINNELKVKIDTPKTPQKDTKAKVDSPKSPPVPLVSANVPRRKRETTAAARPTYLPDEDDSVETSIVTSRPKNYNYDDMSDDNKSSSTVMRSPPHSPLITTARTRSIDSADGSGVEEIQAIRKEKIKSKKGDKKSKRKSKQEYSESLDL